MVRSDLHRWWDYNTEVAVKLSVLICSTHISEVECGRRHDPASQYLMETEQCGY